MKQYISSMLIKIDNSKNKKNMQVYNCKILLYHCNIMAQFYIAIFLLQYFTQLAQFEADTSN